MRTGMWKERRVTAGRRDAERQRDARRRAEGYGVQDRRVPPGQSFRCASSASFQRSRFPVGFLKFTLPPGPPESLGCGGGRARRGSRLPSQPHRDLELPLHPPCPASVRGRAGQSARHCVAAPWESLASARSHARCLKTGGSLIPPAVNPVVSSDHFINTECDGREDSSLWDSQDLQNEYTGGGRTVIHSNPWKQR
ncbi:uncharacterized protein VK521_016122 isoform 1-T1 [Ammospiza maritima maritima]